MPLVAAPDLASAIRLGIKNGVLACRGLVANLYQELWQTVQKAWRERFKELYDIKEAIVKLQIRQKNYPEDFSVDWKIEASKNVLKIYD